MSDRTPVLQIQDLRRTFKQGRGELEVLKGVSLEIYPGEIVALMGQSGSGKTTMLQISGLLERPTSGKILINGLEAGNLDDTARTTLRRHDIGFVYQFHQLLPDFTALENVVMPQLIAGTPLREAEENAKILIEHMGLTDRLRHRPSELSGGEQQRIAIARAVANHPKLLLADEPTGNLDSKTADKVFEELINLVHHMQVGALIATHNAELAARMDRVIMLVDGQIE